MSLTHDLGFVGMVGIIDPLRAEAKGAVQHRARRRDRRAHDHRRPRRHRAGDRRELGLGPGAISGAELQALSDDELAARLPELHVFGRVSPEDKLRLARLMQEQGLIVAMTGDAVNDAAALKQADIGVAMGSGSEVTKQAGRMILTDDNFGTLVHAVEIGRRVYEKVVSYVRYQMTQLLSLVDAVRRRDRVRHQRGRRAHPADGALPPLLRHRRPAWSSSRSIPATPTSCTGRRATRRLPITNRAAVIAVGRLRRRRSSSPRSSRSSLGPDEPSTDVTPPRR